MSLSWSSFLIWLTPQLALMHRNYLQRFSMRSLNEFSLHWSFLLLFYSWSQFYSSILVRQLFLQIFSIISELLFCLLFDSVRYKRWRKAGPLSVFLNKFFPSISCIYTTSLLLRFAERYFLIYICSHHKLTSILSLLYIRPPIISIP